MTSPIFFLLCIVTGAAFAMGFWRLLERFQQSALFHPTKCVSCERQFPSGYAWMGQKTRCFDCERELAARHPHDPSAAFGAHPRRFF